MTKIKVEKLKVLEDNLLIKPLKENDSESSIITPEQYEDKASRGEVIAVGNKVTDVKKGSIVFFNKYSTMSYTLEGEEYLTIRKDDVVMFI